VQQLGCGKELIAILGYEHKTARAATSVALDQVGNAADENLTKLKSVDYHGFVGNALSVEESNDMVGRITDLDVL
jgi:hypothetical protein